MTSVPGVTRVVLDTNVYLSAIVFGGLPSDLLARAHGPHQSIQLVISPPILAEIVRHLGGTFRWPEPRVVRTVAFLDTIAMEVRPSQRLAVVADEPDNRILECAVEGSAEYVVSGDEHLLKVKEHGGIRMVTVTEMLRRLPLLP